MSRTLTNAEVRTTAPGGRPPVRVLITAGPTHEPIDAVRFIGNRSSGRVGVALADEGAKRGWDVTLLLGPTPRTPADSRVRVVRFRTAADLERLLAEEAPRCDVLVMAAAVADYRPHPGALGATGKLRRGDGPVTLTLEPTPDLLAKAAAGRREGQLIVGFALEPREGMLAGARAKLERKGVDLMIANPLETMDSETIEAAAVSGDGAEVRTEGAVTKERFAAWLMAIIEGRLAGMRR
ncbi:MAG: phosphopantothenoylcysteine decarboxylase [Phycisphaerales bacterium]